MSLRRTLLGSLLAGLALAPPVWSAPQGGQVQAGNVQIQGVPGGLNLQQLSDQAIINWQSFSINANEIVRIMQPGTAAVLLNRVVGQDPSIILGQLQANGQVWLVNPNGILFGPNAQVDVAGLLATTLKVSDADFLARRPEFSQDPNRPLSAVINQGQLHVSDGGHVVLLAPMVSNEGVIIANLGQVVLGAGEKASVSFDTGGLIHYSLAKPVGPAGQVALTPEMVTDVVRQVVQQRGVGEAGQLVQQNGQWQLVAGSGTALQAGRIEAAGGQVRVDSTAHTVATGTSLTSVSSSVGAGGDVRLLSHGDLWTQTGSLLSARGATGTQGGFIEASAPHLSLNGTVDAQAPGGKVGTFLIDPDDITIVDGGISGPPPGPTGPYTIGKTNLTTMGQNADVTLQANNSITIQGSAPLSLNHGLTLQADEGNIVFQQPGMVITTGSDPAFQATLNLLAPSGNITLAQLVSSFGITVNAGGSINSLPGLPAGAVNVRALGTSTATLTANGSIGDVVAVSTAGGLTLNAPDASITRDEALTQVTAQPGGEFPYTVVTPPGGISVTGVSQNLTIRNLATDGDLTFTGQTSPTGAVLLQAGRDVTVQEYIVPDVGPISTFVNAAGGVTLSAGRDVIAIGSVGINGAAADLTAGRNVTLSAQTTIGDSNVNNPQPDVQILALAGAITRPAVVGGGGGEEGSTGFINGSQVTMTANTGIDVAGSISGNAGINLSINTTGGTAAIHTDGLQSVGSISLTAPGDIETRGAIGASGPLTVTAGGNYTLQPAFSEVDGSALSSLVQTAHIIAGGSLTLGQVFNTYGGSTGGGSGGSGGSGGEGGGPALLALPTDPALELQAGADIFLVGAQTNSLLATSGGDINVNGNVQVFGQGAMRAGANLLLNSGTVSGDFLDLGGVQSVAGAGALSANSELDVSSTQGNVNLTGSVFAPAAAFSAGTDVSVQNLQASSLAGRAGGNFMVATAANTLPPLDPPPLNVIINDLTLSTVGGLAGVQAANVSITANQGNLVLGDNTLGSLPAVIATNSVTLTAVDGSILGRNIDGQADVQAPTATYSAGGSVGQTSAPLTINYNQTYTSTTPNVIVRLAAPPTPPPGVDPGTPAQPIVPGGPSSPGTPGNPIVPGNPGTPDNPNVPSGPVTTLPTDSQSVGNGLGFLPGNISAQNGGNAPLISAVAGSDGDPASGEPLITVADKGKPSGSGNAGQVASTGDSTRREDGPLSSPVLLSFDFDTLMNLLITSPYLNEDLETLLDESVTSPFLDLPVEALLAETTDSDSPDPSQGASGKPAPNGQNGQTYVPGDNRWADAPLASRALLSFQLNQLMALPVTSPYLQMTIDALLKEPVRSPFLDQVLEKLMKQPVNAEGPDPKLPGS